MADPHRRRVRGHRFGTSGTSRCESAAELAVVSMAAGCGKAKMADDRWGPGGCVSKRMSGAHNRRRWLGPLDVEVTTDPGAGAGRPDVPAGVPESVKDLVHRPSEQVDVVEADGNVGGFVAF